MNDNERSGYCYGTGSRFYINPFTARDGNTMYMVHDADWVTDMEVREGHYSPTVAMFARTEDAEEWCEQVEAGEQDSIPHEANFEGWPALEERVAEWTKSKK